MLVQGDYGDCCLLGFHPEYLSPYVSIIFLILSFSSTLELFLRLHSVIRQKKLIFKQYHCLCIIYFKKIRSKNSTLFLSR
jgi:hypothetical protein